MDGLTGFYAKGNKSAREKYCLSLICGILKKKKKRTNNKIETGLRYWENKTQKQLVVARGKRVE